MKGEAFFQAAAVPQHLNCASLDAKLAPPINWLLPTWSQLIPKFSPMLINCITGDTESHYGQVVMSNGCVLKTRKTFFQGNGALTRYEAGSTFCPRYGATIIFHKYLNPVMLVLI